MKTPDMTGAKTFEEWVEMHDSEFQQNDCNKAHHASLIRCAKDSEIIKELGVCQGGSLSAMLRQHPKKIIGVDIEPFRFNPYMPLFKDYAERNDVEFEFHAKSSLDNSVVSPCDMMHIDSLHSPDHLMKELILHAPTVKKYIVMHDTCNFKSTTGLLVAMAKYITEQDQSWQIVEHYPHRVGHTVIQRINRDDYI